MSSDERSREASRMPREQRARLILDAARDRFGTLGFGGASLGSIAAHAGVSKALIVAYFSSKDDLYAACADQAGRNLSERIEEVITTEQSPRAMAQQTLAANSIGTSSTTAPFRPAPPGTTRPAANDALSPTKPIGKS